MLEVREGGRVANVHALVATGGNADRYRDLLGLQVTSAEGSALWLGARCWPGSTGKGPRATATSASTSPSNAASASASASASAPAAGDNTAPGTTEQVTVPARTA